MNPLIYQTDPAFEDVDHLEGCCVFTLGYIVSVALGVPFTTANMLSWLEQARANGSVVQDDYVQNPQGLADIMSGQPGALIYKGMVPADYAPGPGEFCQDYLFNPDSVKPSNPQGFHHFVIGWTAPGQCTYDPISYGPGQGSNTASAPRTYIESKRLYVKAV